MTATYKRTLLVGMALLAATILSLFSFSTRTAEDDCLDRRGARRNGTCVYQ